MRTLSRIKRYIINFLYFIDHVLKSENLYNVNMFCRLKANSRGFTANQYMIYELNKNNYKDYISEYERWKMREINGPYKFIFDNKIVSHDFFKQYLNVAENLGWVKRGYVYNLSGGISSKQETIDLLKRQGRTILKPNHGGGGKDVYLIAYEEGFLLNKRSIDEDSLYKFIISKNDFLLNKYIIQHSYASSVFDQTVNTIRVVTIFDYEAGFSKIVAAIHRFGTFATVPVDNVSSGGLVSLITIETGELSEAKSTISLDSYHEHPDSHQQIKGVIIPRWNDVLNQIKKVSDMIPFAKLIAWDIVITEKGFSVIETNASTGVNIFQLWGGQKNSELGLYLKKHGIIK